MALAKLKFLESEEVAEIARVTLAKELGGFGFRDVEIEEVEDFEGDQIFRVNALVEKQVSPKKLISALDAINRTLRSRGEFRFVNLSTQFRPADKPRDDQED
jgi:hypothetical protein